MVRGLDIFASWFKDFPDNYVIIGGTACDILIEEAGFTPRATKDIDIILVVEALSADFVRKFWEFIKAGNYERQEKSADDRQYYRFTKPQNKDFPYQLELFAREPDVITLEDDAHLTPIPVDDDLSSLSAILLSDDYYNYMLEHSKAEDGLHLANTEALICLKAKAYLEIGERLAAGSKEDSRHLKKHKNDVFRLAVLLVPEDVFELPESIKSHMQTFANTIANDLPDKQLFKAMGLGGLDVTKVWDQLLKNFQLHGK